MCIKNQNASSKHFVATNDVSHYDSLCEMAIGCFRNKPMRAFT